MPPLALLLLPLLHLLSPALAEAPDRYAVRYAPPGANGNAAARSTSTRPTRSRARPPARLPAPCRCSPTPSPTPTARPPPRPPTRPRPSAPRPGPRSCSPSPPPAPATSTTASPPSGSTAPSSSAPPTAEPTPEGVSWTVRKEVTRYSALLRSPPAGVLSVMLENLVNDQYTGVYNVTVSLEFHGIPAYLSQNSSDSRSKLVTIPSSTYRAVLEVFVSPHSNDEFWYSNPPDLYIQENNLTTPRGNAAYREVVVSVDHHFAGSFVPFPVIYTGGINPLYWQPVSALGAFDLPTYDIELTPFLGLLVDGKAHEFGISVVDGIAEWLVDANLHLWLDPSASAVQASLGRYRTPRLSISRRYSTQLLNGSFSIRAKRKSFFSGWVKSSLGNLTTEVETELETRSLVEFTNDGRNKTVQMKAEQETEVLVRSEARKVIGKLKTESEYPLSFYMDTEDGEDGTSLITGSLSHTSAWRRR
ncbi:peptide-N4-(N-acetyl-beta-glucosaminyl)asparagine amidase A-like [Hordeum vulgare]|nr:peptide-N4-(N-acetyl-beta-glucosaminyl)asparagine amidase A-like [Hordeum vulgare]